MPLFCYIKITSAFYVCPGPINIIAPNKVLLNIGAKVSKVEETSINRKLVLLLTVLLTLLFYCII